MPQLLPTNHVSAYPRSIFTTSDAGPEPLDEEYFAVLELEDDFDTCTGCYRLSKTPPHKPQTFWVEIPDEY